MKQIILILLLVLGYLGLMAQPLKAINSSVSGSKPTFVAQGDISATSNLDSQRYTITLVNRSELLGNSLFIATNSEIGDIIIDGNGGIYEIISGTSPTFTVQLLNDPLYLPEPFFGFPAAPTPPINIARPIGQAGLLPSYAFLGSGLDSRVITLIDNYNKNQLETVTANSGIYGGGGTVGDGTVASSNNGDLVFNYVSPYETITDNFFTKTGIIINRGLNDSFVGVTNANEVGFITESVDGSTKTSMSIIDHDTVEVNSNNSTFSGITYSADYSANYTDRSLVDKSYVDTKVADSRPYKIYTALLTQFGSSAPFPTILENTLGFIPVWTRTGRGIYKLVIQNENDINKIFPIITLTNSLSYEYEVIKTVVGANTEMGLVSYSSGAPSDSILDFYMIEVRVYN